MLEILKKIRAAHIEDIRNSKNHKHDLAGLCCIAFHYLSPEDERLFIIFLENNTPAGTDIVRYIWDTDYENTERLDWLNKHIKILSQC